MLLFVLGKVYNITIHPATIPQTHTVQKKKLDKKQQASCFL